MVDRKFHSADEDSAGGGVVEGTLIDITERKRAEEELYGSRQMLQSILDAIPHACSGKKRVALISAAIRHLRSMQA